jgi:hypothetical protein
MNDVKERNATIANKKGSIKLLLGCAAFVGGALTALSVAAPAMAATTGSAPALSGVKEMIVESVKIGTSQANGNLCALTRGEIDTAFLKMLRNYGLPAFSPVEAKPPQIGVGRIDLVPEIVSISSQGTECSNWVALSAQTHSTVRVPPIETPRNVVVTYWRGGLMLNNSETTQARSVMEALEKLVRQFSEQYRLDQPPPMPNLDDEPADRR